MPKILGWLVLLSLIAAVTPGQSYSCDSLAWCAGIEEENRPAGGRILKAIENRMKLSEGSSDEERRSGLNGNDQNNLKVAALTSRSSCTSEKNVLSARTCLELRGGSGLQRGFFDRPSGGGQRPRPAQARRVDDDEEDEREEDEEGGEEEGRKDEEDMYEKFKAAALTSPPPTHSFEEGRKLLEQKMALIQGLQKEQSKVQEGYSTLLAQENENAYVLKELQLVGEGRAVLKCSGPVLLPQEKSAAIDNVKKRLAFIRKELKRASGRLKELEQKADGEREAAMKVQAQLQQQQLRNQQRQELHMRRRRQQELQA